MAADDFLSAELDKRFSVKLSYDFMQEKFDVFNIESHDIKTDYKGAHLTLDYAPIDTLSFNATYWQRQLNVASIDADITSWSLAATYQFFSNQTLTLAVRAAWAENYTGTVRHNYNLLQGASASTQTAKVQFKKPQDKQKQLDFIASFNLSPNTLLNTYLSLGQSRVSFDDYHITGTHGGCLYNLYFSQTGYSGQLAQPCSANVVVTQFYSPYGADDIRIYDEMRYKTRYYQAGLSLKWEKGRWALLGAYRFIYLDRSGIDDNLQQRKQASYNKNQIFSAMVSYSPIASLSLSASAQLFNNQMNGEIPFLYNSASAKYFNRRYGLLSLGLQWQFKQ